MKFLYNFKGEIIIMKKYVVVTGGASGIGQYIAQQYTKKEYQVIVIDREKNNEENLISYICDLCDEEMTIATFEKIPRIDLAINCAGVSCIRDKLIQFSAKEISTQWAQNFLPSFNALKQEIKIMKSNGGGKIINIASVSGSIGMKNFIAYSAAKASIINMTKVAAIEHAEDKIFINSISPATIDTPMIRKKYNGGLKDYSNTYYTGHCGTVEDVYSVVLMLEQNNFMTGNDIILDGGMLNLHQI